MKVEELMTPAVHTCRPEDTLAHAAQLLWERDCGALPVVDDDRRVVGLVTDRDLLMGAHFSGRPLNELLVVETMSAPVRAVRTTDTLEQAAKVLTDERLHRLPVVGKDDRLAGIVTLADLAGSVSRPKTVTERRALADRVVATFAAIHTARPAVSEPVVELTPPAPSKKKAKKKATTVSAGEKKKATTKSKRR